MRSTRVEASVRSVTFHVTLWIELERNLKQRLKRKSEGKIFTNRFNLHLRLYVSLTRFLIRTFFLFVQQSELAALESSASLLMRSKRHIDMDIDDKMQIRSNSLTFKRLKSLNLANCTKREVSMSELFIDVSENRSSDSISIRWLILCSMIPLLLPAGIAIPLNQTREKNTRNI